MNLILNTNNDANDEQQNNKKSTINQNQERKLTSNEKNRTYRMPIEKSINSRTITEKPINNKTQANRLLNEKNRYNNLSNYKFRGNTYSQKADIIKVIRIFAILCIIIGVAIAGKSVYALTFGRAKPQDIPQVRTEKMGKEVTISISTQYPIKEFKYRWNDGVETEIKGNETVDISETIEIPNGNNILNIIVTDYYGNKTEYQKTYLYESSDVIKPTIRFEKIGTKLRIIANDETALLYMTYQWNDEEPVRKDATESETELIEEIEVEKGRGKLTVIAVDKEENKETITRTIVGANKPTFTIDAEQNNLVVTAKDDDGLKTISIFVDGEEKRFEANSIKEAIAKVEIGQGTHMIKVVVTNINEQEATRELRATI